MQQLHALVGALRLSAWARPKKSASSASSHDRVHGLWDPVVAWRNGSVPEVVADGESSFIVESMDEVVAAIDRVRELDPHVMRAQGPGAVLG